MILLYTPETRLSVVIRSWRIPLSSIEGDKYLQPCSVHRKRGARDKQDEVLS